MASFSLNIMESAFVRAGLVDGKADAGLPDVECFICEERVTRALADYDAEFDLWECKTCRLRRDTSRVK